MNRTSTRCVDCSKDMEPSHMFGGLRYYVCRRCNRWAVPFPPGEERTGNPADQN